ncbi:NAP1-related protein 2 [Hibiscus syriacus]|uniref:NAP1-related protein 2 n=1 Tax=Hibiscus syriacus TaxID=106335 RepID=A0A6A2YV52_HIBSY|nr:NAP1-related protein 2 [Hibiscus syriacus]
MNSMISVSSTAPPSIPPPRPHNDPTLLFYNIILQMLQKTENPEKPMFKTEFPPQGLFYYRFFHCFVIYFIINEEASEKVLEVEQKYNEIRKPIYDKRNEKINHPALGELLNDEDQKIFKYISSLEVEDFKDLKSGYSITFNFDPNPYFEDANLTKTFTFLDEGTKITATKIKWKEGMDLPNGVDHEKKGNKRQFAEERHECNFFTWFSDAQQKDDMDEIHDEVAEIIKDDLWPNPLTYFNNDADEEDFEDDEELHHLLPSFFFQLLNS